MISNPYIRVRFGDETGKDALPHWFDPRNGDIAGAGTFILDESREMIPPVGWEDAILVLRTALTQEARLK